MNQPSFDILAAHRWFSTDCFNEVWNLLDKTERTPEEDEQMIALCYASLAHWRARPDCASRNLSVGYWQLSRVYAVLQQADNAWHYANLCWQNSTNETPFYQGYAHESLARAARIASKDAEFQQHLQAAQRLVSEIENDEDRRALEADLLSLNAVSEA